MDKVKWGVMGIGGIAQRRTVPEMMEVDNSQLVAVMDIVPELSEKLAKRFGAKWWYTKEKELLKNDEVEAVYIASPQHLHCQQVIMAAECGKHILCEKPIATNIEEAERMIDVCKKHKVKLMPGYMMRFQAIHKKAKEIIDKGEIGNPVFGRAQLTCWYPDIPGAWRQDPGISHGGALIDMGTHCIDVLEMLIGRVKEVFAFQGTLTHRYKVEDSSALLLKFDNGAHGLVDNNFNIPDAAAAGRLEVYGTEGSLLAEGTISQEPGGKLTLIRSKQGSYESAQTRPEKTTEEIRVNPVPMYGEEVRHLSECILEDKEPIISGEEGLRNLKIVLAAYESAKQRKPVEIKT